jgi:hypothetical protein
MRSAGMKTTPDAVYYEGQGIPVISPSPDPVEVATGAAIIKDAETRGKYSQAMVELLKARTEAAKKGEEGASAKSKKLVGVVINDSLVKELFFDHPSFNWFYGIRVGKYEFVPFDKLPNRLNYWWGGDKKKRSFRVMKPKEPEEYNGIPVDFIVRIKR